MTNKNNWNWSEHFDEVYKNDGPEKFKAKLINDGYVQGQKDTNKKWLGAIATVTMALLPHIIDGTKNTITKIKENRESASKAQNTPTEENK